MVPKGETKKRIPEYEYSPLTFSIETKGGISTPLIRRGTPLPSKRNQIFSTAEDNQKSVEIHVLIGERPLAKYNVSFGRCLLSNIPPAKLGTPQIRVTFDVYKSCDISIETLETKSGVKVDIRC